MRYSIANLLFQDQKPKMTNTRTLASHSTIKRLYLKVLNVKGLWNYFSESIGPNLDSYNNSINYLTNTPKIIVNKKRRERERDLTNFAISYCKGPDYPIKRNLHICTGVQVHHTPFMMVIESLFFNLTNRDMLYNKLLWDMNITIIQKVLSFLS